MSTFAIFVKLMCFHACLVQNAYSQCHPSRLHLGYGVSNIECGCGRGYGTGFASGQDNCYGWNAAEVDGAYGGVGTGDLDIGGQLPVAGTTVITGQVPIIGAVQFGGEVPAAGVVSIFGKCGCDCNGTPLF